MSFPYDDPYLRGLTSPAGTGQPLLEKGPTEEERLASETIEEAVRSKPQEFLDAIVGRKRPSVVQPDTCPKCQTRDAKVRGNVWAGGTLSRKCRNKACRHEWVYRPHSIPIAVLPTPPQPPLFGSSSDRTYHEPAPDFDQPINRRLSEAMRRMNRDE